MQKTCHDLLHNHDQMGSGYIVQPATQSIRLSDLQTMEQAVQRCRNHKVRNVLDELPKEQ